MTAVGQRDTVLGKPQGRHGPKESSEATKNADILAAVASGSTLVVLPRRINMHMLEARLLVEGRHGRGHP